RKGMVSHAPPAKAKQHVWRPPKEAPKSAKVPSPTSDKADKKNKKGSKAKKKPKEASSSAGPAAYADKDKKSLLFSLDWHHPTSSLEVGTLEANTKRVFLDSPDIQQEVVKCIKEGSSLAVDVKRDAQRLIGQFLENLRTRIDAEVAKAWSQKTNGERLSESERLKARRDALSENEREILDYLAGTIKPKEDGSDEDDMEDSQDGAGGEDSEDSEEDDSKHLRFLQSFLIYLYSRNLPKKATKVGGAVDTFIGILASMDLLNISRTRGEINKNMPFMPTNLVRSVASQLAGELKRCIKPICTIKKKSGLEDGIDCRIQEDITAIENYIALNDMIPNRWRLAPFTSSKQALVSFSERELATFFWKKPLLNQRLEDLARLDNTTVTSISDLDAWIGGLAPGLITKNFVCDIDPSGLSNRRRRKTGHRGAIIIKSLDAIRNHLQMVKETKPKDYQAKGYVPRGSIRTDGFRVQVLAFKLRVRQDARYKRLPQEDLPDRLTSTVAGTEYYLTEIRNVIRTKDNVERLWPGKDIRGKNKDNAGGGEWKKGIVLTSQEAAVDLSDPSQVSKHISNPASPQTTAQTVEASAPAFYNLAVKQKAVYQPTFRFRRWQETKKEVVPEGEEESISSIESRLPPLHGSASSIVDHVGELQQVEERLKKFYMEYQAIAERLLGIVGGSLGRRLKDNDGDDAILIGIGLGQFMSNSRLSSLHSSFLEYFIKT
ncbi:hypothetical protein BGW39_003286, partial [Mortierella sp. 14UC]